MLAGSEPPRHWRRCSGQVVSALPGYATHGPQRFGSRQIVALGEVDTELLQALERLGSLDAFGYRGNPQCSGHLGDGLDHAAIDGIGGEAADELAVDLEEIHGQALEIVER